MSKILTNNQYYHQIADVIREQNGTSNTYKPAQMVSALKDLFYEEAEGVPPISFNGIGENLLDYKIDGASGGVGDRTKNFIQNTATTQTKNGVTFTVNEDKSISCNGTASSNVFFKIGDIQLKKNCIMSGCPEGGANNSYVMRLYNNGSVFKTDSGDGVLINSEIQNGYAEIRIAAGYTCDNLTFYPMIRLASIEDDTYEPYGYKVPVVVSGKNLFNKNNILRNAVQDAGTYKAGNGTIVLIIDVSNIDTVSFQTGVRTQRCRSAFSVEYPAVGVSYTINNVNTFQNNDNNTGKITRTVPSGANYLGVQIYRNSGNYTEEEINNAINSFIACNGNNIGNYEPYIEPTTTNIYLDEPILENESISLSDTNTNIPTIRGTNVLTVDTTVQPSNVYIKSRHESSYETAMRERFEEAQAQLDALENGGE